MSVAWMSLNNMRLAISLALALAPGIAVAADLPPAAPEPPTAPAIYAPAQPGWTVTVGVERAVPAWPGAYDSRFGLSVLPLFSIRKAGTPPEFFGARDSFGFRFLISATFNWRGWRADLATSSVVLYGAEWVRSRQLRDTGRRLRSTGRCLGSPAHRGSPRFWRRNRRRRRRVPGCRRSDGAISTIRQTADRCNRPPQWSGLSASHLRSPSARRSRALPRCRL